MELDRESLPHRDLGHQTSNQNLDFQSTSLGIEKGGKLTPKQAYKKEADVISKKLGGLEGVRHELGMTQRKMCQLLMVDPSAWTRWLKDESKIPPHIFRSLQWYMALIDKKPEWHPQNAYLGAFRSQPSNDKKIKEELGALRMDLDRKLRQSKPDTESLEEYIKQLEGQVDNLANQIQRGSQVGDAWKFIAIINLVLLLYFLIF